MQVRNLLVIEAGCAKRAIVFRFLSFLVGLSEWHGTRLMVVAHVLSLAEDNQPETALHGGTLDTEEHVFRT